MIRIMIMIINFVVVVVVVVVIVAVAIFIISIMIFGDGERETEQLSLEELRHHVSMHLPGEQPIGHPRVARIAYQVRSPRAIDRPTTTTTTTTMSGGGPGRHQQPSRLAVTKGARLARDAWFDAAGGQRSVS